MSNDRDKKDDDDDGMISRAVSAINAVLEQLRRPQKKRGRPPLSSNDPSDPEWVGGGGANRRRRIDQVVDQASRGE